MRLVKRSPRHDGHRPPDHDARHPAGREGLERQAPLHAAGGASVRQVEWELRDARIGHGDKRRLRAARTSSSRRRWSQNATNIVAQKYFRGQLDSPARERSVKQMIGRVAGTIADWGRERGYFATRRGRRRLRGRAHLHPAPPDGGVQLAGLVQRRLRGAAAVLGLLHPLASRTRWSRSSTGTRKEGKIFRGGSGSGINLSNIRGSMEPLSKGGTASGPGLVHARRRLVGRHDQVRRQDAPRGEDGRARRRPPGHPRVHLVQGQGGGQGRRAARRRASTCRSTATASRRSSTRTPTTRSASPTSSCTRSRTTSEWHLIARTTGEPVGEPIPARELMREIAEAAWRCADPGVQYDTTINQWHTSPELGAHQRVEPVLGVHARRRLGLQPRVAEPHEVPPRRTARFDVDAFEHAVDIVFLAQEIVVGAVELPDRGDRRQRARVPPARPRLREPRRLPDGQRHALRLRRGPRHGGRDHGADDRPRLPRSRRRSPRRSGPYERYAENREPHNAVMRMHRDASYAIPDATCADERAARRRARASWDEAVAARRALRLPQRAGDGARADGDDLVPHGLRHDRHRARLLAGQVQGARRRRADDDRQPHGAAGAADARLRRRRRSSRSRRTSTSTARSSARPAWPTSTCRSSTSRSASARSRTWATSR